MGLLLGVCLLSGVGVAQPPPGMKGFINAGEYPSLQEAIDAVPPEGGTVYIPAGSYEVTKTIDLSRRYGLGAVAGRGAVTLQGAGITATRINGKTGERPVFDLSASGYCHLKDMYITGEADVGVLLCRGKGEGEASAGAIVFDSVYLAGKWKKAGFYDMAGECCRFYNSFFETTAPNSFAVYYGPDNFLNVPSPSVEIMPSSNTEMRFVGCTFGSFAENSVGLYVRGSAADISVWGSYFANRGRAAVVLDGTKGCVDSVSLTDVRIEGEHGRYCVYAEGCVRRVTITGGAWVGTGAELIRYVAPDENTWAENWRISQVAIEDPSVPGFYPRTFPKGEDGYVFARFDALQSSILELTWSAVARFEKDADGKETVHYQTDRKLLVIDKQSRANQITVRDAADVAIHGTATDTQIIPLGQDGGVQFAP